MLDYIVEDCISFQIRSKFVDIDATLNYTERISNMLLADNPIDRLSNARWCLCEDMKCSDMNQLFLPSRLPKLVQRTSLIVLHTTVSRMNEAVSLQWSTHYCLLVFAEAYNIHYRQKIWNIFISSIFCIFVGCAGCFYTWNTFLRADISLGELISTSQQNEVQRLKNNYFGIFLN